MVSKVKMSRTNGSLIVISSGAGNFVSRGKCDGWEFPIRTTAVVLLDAPPTAKIDCRLYLFILRLKAEIDKQLISMIILLTLRQCKSPRKEVLMQRKEPCLMRYYGFPIG